MNDRYLYRAKRTDNGEWVEGYYLFCPIQVDNKHSVENFIYKHWIVTHNGNPFEVYPSTICQCTGLKDKNGKLIWENDIVDIQHYAENAHKVKWGYGGFYVGINGLLCHYNTVCEVIGNIFDNACIDELLKGEEG